MDITPFYELRTRLKAAIIAGTSLLGEDFRLKRAVEDIQPFSKAAPVFAKISGLASSVVAPGDDSGNSGSKEGLILDTLNLVDALLCTQGAVDVKEEIAPVDLCGAGNISDGISYSELKELINALTQTGSGRYDYLHGLHRAKPEFFSDYRVIPALVQALGDPYPELADNAEEWIAELGEDVLPVLKKGFNPKGRKEMLRRLRTIEKIAGAKENGFYISQLEEAEKDIKCELVYALRHSQDNEELLSGLVNTERGNARKMAYRALAHQNGEIAENFFKKLMEKKPGDALLYMGFSETGWASALASGYVNSFAEKLRKMPDKEEYLASKEGIKEINNFTMGLWALDGKNSQDICTCCRNIMELAEEPDMPYIRCDNDVCMADEKKSPASLKLLIARHICNYIVINHDKELCLLAIGLYDKNKETGYSTEFFHSAVIAKMLMEEDCTEWLRNELKEDKDASRYNELVRILKCTYWNEIKNTWEYKEWIYDNVIKENVIYTCQLKQHVEGSFTQVVTSMFIYNLEKHDKMYGWDIVYFLRNLPVSLEERQAEARKLTQMVKDRGLGNKLTGMNIRELERYVENKWFWSGKYN